ncbi:MAG: T9SS type A sorting domain-containing protein [Bacteroidota bacterium]
MFRLLFVAFTCWSFSTWAQRPRRAQGPFKMIEEHQAQLQLTAEQTAQIAELKTSLQTEREQLRTADPDDRHTTIKSMRLRVDEAFQQILTPEQLATLATIKTTKRAEYRKRALARIERQEQLHAERKAYFEEHQLPILQIQRAKLESQLTEADKAIIQDLRLAADAYRAQRTAERAAKKAALEQGGEKQEQESARGKFRGRKHRRALFVQETDQDQAQALVEQYATQIDALQAEISEYEAQWKVDRERQRTTHRAEMEKTPPNEIKAGRKHARGNRHRGKRADRMLMKKIRFLLLEPGSEVIIDQLAVVSHQLNAYPNPAWGTQTIAFEILEKGAVQIQLVDKTGQVVREVYNGQLSAGSHQMEVALNGLQEGLFYYQVRDAKGISSTPIFVKR